MSTLPLAGILLLRPFAPIFSKPAWAHAGFCMSGDDTEMVKVSRILIERFTETLSSVA